MTVEERIDHLRAIITEFQAAGDETAAIMAASLVCNGCGYIVTSTIAALPSLLDDWQLGDWREDADFCPRCAT